MDFSCRGVNLAPALPSITSKAMDGTLDSPLPPLRASFGGAVTVSAEDFDEIVRMHQRRVYRVLLALLRDPDAADTLTQECFLRAFRGRHSFRGDASVGTWLVRIAVNLARDHGRSPRQAFWRRMFGKGRAEVGEVAARISDHSPSPERTLLAREALGAVWVEVDKLSPQQRNVFVLRFVEEMTLEEIAQVTGLEVGSVKSHLFRAVSNIRRQAKERPTR